MNTCSSTQHTGVITRICNFKYGFLSSDEHANIFFHFSELSDEAKAFIEPGQQVTFQTAPNGDNKIKAVKLQVISAAGDNKFKNLSGVVQGGMQSRGFCFIKEDETLATYLFHATNLVDDDASKEAGNTVTEGHKVTFDAEWNHKYNPPKPFATNVRLMSGQTELNKVSAAIEQQPMQPSRESSTWQRGSRLGLEALPEESDVSPPNRLGSVGRLSSVRDRASALKANAPVRRWSRTTNLSGENKSEKPAGGLRLTVTTCKFGRKCTRTDCWFEHPNGRQMDDGRTSLTDDSDDSSGDEKVSSMGKSSLKLLVKAIVMETGKSGYLHIRNYLQKPEYVGRALTRDEKNAVGEVLEELEKPTGSPTQMPTRESMKGMKGRSWRQSSNSRLPIARTSFANGRVSLSDMCRDPSLHSRLSCANQACA
jgi:cold shock CspA family protein